MDASYLRSQATVPPEILYRFEVVEPRTGDRYFVLIGEDGLAYREVSLPPSPELG